MVDGPNLYAYVTENPWTKFDPEGLEGFDPRGIQYIGEAIGDWYYGFQDRAGEREALYPLRKGNPEIAKIADQGILGRARALQQMHDRSNAMSVLEMDGLVPEGTTSAQDGADKYRYTQIKALSDEQSSINTREDASIDQAIGVAALLLPMPSKLTKLASANINIDTGTAVAFVSEGSIERQKLKAVVAGNNMVMTETAFAEFQGTLRSAGVLEKARAQDFLKRVTIIPDTPSARAMNLRVTRKVGANDRIIFGTGDQLGIRTMTSDGRFLRGSSAQGVDFDAYLHDPVPFTGK